MIQLILELAAPYAASYVVAKVAGRLGGSTAGRFLSAIAREMSSIFSRSASETALAKLTKGRELTTEERANLSQDELNAIDHARSK